MAQYERVVIVGVGLLGGSLGLALRDRRLARQVVGVGRHPAGLETARARGAIDVAELDLAAACRGADLVVLCTPVQRVAPLAEECLPYLASGALITDVGSTKQRICAALADSGRDQFCGSHPLAGSDKSGVAFAEAGLFDGRLTIVTPGPATPADLVERAERLWQQLGSRTLRMDPHQHDMALAKTSHLPHVVAAALAAATPEEALPLVASGWCDTTRVAGGGADLWRQILVENREPVLHALENYAASLAEWVLALKNGDDQLLESLLRQGKQRRDSVGP